LTPAAATLSNPAAAGVKFLRRNCKTLPPPGVKCGRHIHAFCRDDNMCQRPSRAWKKKYEELKRSSSL